MRLRHHALAVLVLGGTAMTAFSDEGNPVAVDEGQDPKPTLLLCPPHPDRLYLAA